MRVRSEGLVEEIHGANTQGKTLAEARRSLKVALTRISLLQKIFLQKFHRGVKLEILVSLLAEAMPFVFAH
jgi:hypothetical protein